ncbi:mitochondrial ribonuclease P catalytic subunit isoform X2 [Tachypleus tridentatus]|uniref:mitochondrial ribonuclease P catalytic subunit isoform X2 n=1 Tax=Tachypleus tridentatus TaxID=6853 RepID=UPI003FD49F90
MIMFFIARTSFFLNSHSLQSSILCTPVFRYLCQRTNFYVRIFNSSYILIKTNIRYPVNSARHICTFYRPSENLVFTNKLCTRTFIKCSRAHSNMTNKHQSHIKQLKNKQDEGSQQRRKHNLLFDVCSNKDNMSVEEWKQFRYEMITSLKHRITEHSFDGTVMRAMLSRGNCSLAKSFMKYLKAMEIKPNLVTVSSYMALCGQKSEDADEQEILNVYNTLCDLPSEIDVVTAEGIICGLCVTSQWREALKIVDKIHSFTNPSQNSLNAIACSAFRNGDVDCAWNIIEKIVDAKHLPGEQVYCSSIWLAKQLINNETADGFGLMERLLNFFHANEVQVTLYVARLIKDYFEEYGTAQNGVCQSCRGKINPIKLQTSEFETLKEAFLNRVFMGKDIFLSTTTDEFKDYCNFINSNAPFDIVVDSLNVAYAQKRQNSKALAEQLLTVVRHFTKAQKKVLVLGRKHMEYWPKQEMAIISKLSSCFFADDVSKDDCFLLYATMMSGMGSMFVSRDLMRDHLFRLHDSYLAKVFTKWLKLHQLYLVRVEKPDRVVIQGPQKFHITTQGCTQTGWHIPYIDEKVVGPYDTVTKWLCLQRTL